MEQIEQLQAAATALLEKAKDAPISDLACAVDKAAAVQRLCSDLEKTKAELRRLALEERKLQHESETAHTQERIRDYVSLLTPLISILALATTVFLQAWQFTRSEKDKADAALDAQWAEAQKGIAAASKVPPAIIALRPFLSLPKYADRAKFAVVDLLANSTDPNLFHDLFGAAFVPMAWDNLTYVVKLDRAITAKGTPLWIKSYDRQKDMNDPTKLAKEERDLYDYVERDLPILSSHLASLLQTPRPNGIELDLSAMTLKSFNLDGADLRASNIVATTFSWGTLKGANLDNITQFEGAYFYHVAWWEAARISPQLLTYLENNTDAKYKPDMKYGSWNTTATYVEPEAYAAALARLKAQNTPAQAH